MLLTNSILKIDSVDIGIHCYIIETILSYVHCPYHSLSLCLIYYSCSSSISTLQFGFNLRTGPAAWREDRFTSFFHGLRFWQVWLAATFPCLQRINHGHSHLLKSGCNNDSYGIDLLWIFGNRSSRIPKGLDLTGKIRYLNKTRPPRGEKVDIRRTAFSLLAEYVVICKVSRSW